MSSRIVALACVFSLMAGTAYAEEDERALGVRDVVRVAKQHNPALKASLLELESARWDVFGSEAAYEPVLTLEGSGSQTATPNVFGGNVRINRVRRGDAAAQLSKHLIWGTDLTLRISGSVQWSRSLGTFGINASTAPTTGTSTTIPLSFFPNLGSFGPLYGMIARFSLKQPLWRGRGRDLGEATMREARLQRTAAEHTRNRVSSETLRDALTAYWELWYAHAALAIQEKSQEVAVRQRDDAKARAASGSLAPAEVLTFETQVATREEEVLEARAERERRAYELARLLGDNEQPMRFGALLDEPGEGRAFPRETVEQRALSQSAEIRERAAAVELSQLRQKTADDPKKPRLDLDSYVQAQGLGNESVGDAAEQFVKGDVLSGMVGLTYEAPLRDRVRRAEAAKARLATEVAEEQLRQTRQQVIAQVRTALDREETARDKVRLAEQTAAIAERQLAAEQVRYQSGSSTPLQVLEAEDKVRSAQLRLARARADLAEGELVLEHFTGELLARFASF